MTNALISLTIRATVVVFALSLVGLSTSAVDARGLAPEKNAPEKTEGRAWIVQLEAPASVQFGGGSVASIMADGKRVTRMLEATAPAVTGARRLDVETPAVRDYVKHLDGERSAVLTRAQTELGFTIKPRHVYHHVMNGFSAEMTLDEARRLAELPGVRSVERETIHYLHTDAGPQWIGATRYWTGQGGVPAPNRGDGMVLGVIDTGINWESVFFDLSQPGAPNISNPRPGFLGLCSQPDVPCSNKIIGVYDFTDEDTNGEDPDGHGSHVASTAAGIPLSFNANFPPVISFSTSGVAPNASIISYKACKADEEDPVGNFTCSGSDTRAALEQAIIDQVDVVNYSIGGDPFNPWAAAQLFLNLRDAGIVASVAAGNEGPGLGTVSSPANAPWVLSVANATHNRALGNQLVQTSGGEFALGSLSGFGSDSTTVRPIVHASDYGSALCGTGPAENGSTCAANTGASSPFAPGTFNGEIVVCDRGEYGRIEKGRNVLAAGAGGMIVANTAVDGESINDDDHCLPATHVGAIDGDRLRDWLDGGSGHQGRLTGLARTVDAVFGGRINSSSSRGPATGAPNIMKPNVTAPGTLVLAAGANDPNALTFLTGTSMSAPHVAGAALLLRKSHPDWGVDEVISALETTADASIVRLPDGSPANTVDRGAGGIQVDRAARIGLFLPTSRSEFIAANPATGGDPGELNLPGIVSDSCADTCEFTRRVRALGNGQWSVSTEGDLDISVTPETFSLSAGQEQTLTVTIRSGPVAIGSWGTGSVLLAPTGGSFVQQRLPVGALVTAGTLPSQQDYTSDNNHGRDTLVIDDLGPLSEALYRTSPLVRPQQRTASLPQDPTNTNPFDRGAGVQTELFEVPAGALLLHAETFASVSNDVDLFVGRDSNGNGRADESEVVCASTSPDELERCLVELPEQGTWWILVQNWTSSSPGATDDIPFEFAVLAEDNDPSLVVSGPGAHPGGPIELPVYWDQPGMLRNERWMGAIGIASSVDFFANVGVVPVTVTRTSDNDPQYASLFEGRDESIVVPADSTDTSRYIDVPESAISLTVTAEGGIDGLQLDFTPADDVRPSPNFPAGDPVTLPVVATGTESGGVWTATVDAPAGSTLDSGRYGVRIETGAGNEVAVTLRADVTETGRIEPQRGLWSPRDRTTNQGIEWQKDPSGNAFVTWYTYDEDGAPEFFISDSGQPDPERSYFTAPLYRVTSNGIRQNVDQVGEIQVSSMGENLVYAWRLNGYRGSEVMRPSHGPDCPIVDGQPQQLLGHWALDGVREGGAAVLFTSQVEVWVRYYFDKDGEPRWVYVDGELEPTLPDGKRLEVQEFRGYCIYCDSVPITNETVGALERQFESPTRAREIIDFVAGPPVDTDYSTDRHFRRVSGVESCPNAN